MKKWSAVISLIFTCHTLAVASHKGGNAYPAEARPFGVGVNIGGPTLLTSFCGQYFLNRNISTEAGFGLLGVYGCAKIHFAHKKTNPSLSPFLGFGYSFIGTPPEGGGDGYYFTAGFQSISAGGYGFAVEALYADHLNSNLSLWFALKWSYHFNL